MSLKTEKYSLHELLREYKSKHAVICSFTFDIEFFEDHCLKKYSSLREAENITVLIDQRIYQDKIKVSRKANLDYLLLPIACNGVFHPKLFLLLDKDKARLIIGSANFSTESIKNNAELICCYDYEKNKKESYKSLFQQAFSFLIELSKQCAEYEYLQENLKRIMNFAPWIAANNEEQGNNQINILHNLGIPLWQQIINKIESPVKSVYILSRFYDKTPAILDKIISDLEPETIKIYTQNKSTTITPSWFEHSAVKSGKVKVFQCEYYDEYEDAYQTLHGKAIAIETKNNNYLYAGSANFTTAGLFSTFKSGNTEILIEYSGLNKSIIPIEDFFNPNKKAEELNPSNLKSATQVTDQENHFDFKLYEAKLIENLLSIKAEGLLHYTNLNIHFECSDDEYFILPITPRNEEILTINIPEKVLQQINKIATVVFIQGIENNNCKKSNNMLIINLNKLYESRKFKDSSSEIISDSDLFKRTINDYYLKGNLDYLDEFKDFLREFSFGYKTNEPVGVTGNRQIKFKDIFSNYLSDEEPEKIKRPYFPIKDEVADFCNKHINKLERHIKDKKLGGIENFLEITVGLLELLSMQLIAAIESFKEEVNLTGSLWGEYRRSLGTYFSLSKSLFLLTDEYFKCITKKHPKKLDIIKERFKNNIEPIYVFNANIISYYDNLNSLRINKLVFPDRSLRTAEFNGPNDGILKENNWRKYEKQVIELIDNLKKEIDDGLIQ